ncbi:MAG: hypothetical protein JXA13_09005 [Anaerolineales bacterium]|nr:hypothetical protein [Anaerolineales bacterium]
MVDQVDKLVKLPKDGFLVSIPKRFLIVLIIILVFYLSACNQMNSFDPYTQINSAVAATIASIPTQTPLSASTPYPTPTPHDLNGLFCEYQFCIGHPVGMHFYDISAARDQQNPSTYAQGMVVTYNQNRFILLSWQSMTGQGDPQFMMDLVLDEVDTRSSNMDISINGDLNVYFYSITTQASPAFPYGAIAAWTCGNRAFGWKAYTAEENIGIHLLEESLSKFICDYP